MATTGVGWASGHGGRDMHAVQGQWSPDLRPHLLLEQDQGARQPIPASNPPPGTRVRFLPVFAPNATGTRLTGDYFEIDLDSGQVKPDQPGALFRLENVILRAVVTVPGQPKPFVETIRVHLHDRLVRAWFTPTTLTLRASGTSTYEFTVLAEFGDGTIGDISTTGHGLKYEVPSTSSVVLNPGDPTDGRITPLQTTSQPVRVTAVIPSTLGGAPASGNPSGPVTVLPAWSQIPIEWLGGAHRGLRDAVPNILILADGFQDDSLTDPNDKQKTRFFELAQLFVKEMETNSATQPFGMLRGSMNYWAAFVPSPQYGINTLPELYEETTDKGTHGVQVPIPRPPAATTAAYTLEELVYLVGLPTRDRAAAQDFQLRIYWTSQFGVNNARLTPKVIAGLQKLGTRKLANEHNTVFGIANGDRPQALKESALHNLGFHPRRSNRGSLDELLLALVEPGTPAPPTPIGRLWTIDPAGKDRDHLVVLCAGATKGGTASQPIDAPTRTDLIAVGLASTDVVPIKAGLNLPELEAQGHPVPEPQVAAKSFALHAFAHEIAHSFRLGDEYGIRVGDPSDAEQVLGDTFFNIQRRATLGGQNLSAENVRWRWPRVTFAAALTGRPTLQSGTTYHVPIVRRQLTSLRLRPPAKLRLRIPLSDYPTVPIARRVSPELTFVTVNASAGVVVVTAPPTGFTPADFKKDSVLCIPVPSGITNDPWVELMSRRARERINTSGGPLNAPADQPRRPCSPGEEENSEQESTNWPPDPGKPNPPFNGKRIIGLYEGGSTFACSFLHPAGICKMRQAEMGFCLVCSYVLVDLINATMHGVLERHNSTAKLYPRTT